MSVLYKSRSALAVALLAWLSPATILFAQSADDFDAAMKRALSYPIQFDDRSSIQHGIDLYEQVIVAYLDHPRIHEAKLNIFDIMRSDGTKESLRKGAGIIEQLVDAADLNDAVGQDIGMRYVSFHISEARGYPFAKPDKARRIAEHLLDIGKREERSLLALRMRRQLGMMLIHERQYAKAMDYLLDALEETSNWGANGYYHKLFKESPRRYSEYKRVRFNIAHAAIYALERSKDEALADALRARPKLLDQYAPLRRGLERFDNKAKQPSGGKSLQNRPIREGKPVTGRIGFSPS